MRLALVLSLLVGCGSVPSSGEGPARDRCTGDADCAAPERCLTAEAAGPGCGQEVRVTCADGSTSDACGRCRVACARDRDCERGELCRAGTCDGPRACRLDQVKAP